MADLPRSKCPTCGAAVEVVSGDEGTSYYQPAASEMVELLRRAASLFPVEKPEHGGDPEWVAAIKRDVREAIASSTSEGNDDRA